jgi:hypothetical protein
VSASHGPHASAVKFILKGPNTRWPTQSNGTTRWTYGNHATGAGTANGLFCLNCHDLTQTAVHTQGEHSAAACSGCHIRIPHGGKVKRLIRTANTPAPYIDVAGSATNTQATWSTGVSVLNAYSGGVSNGSTSCGASCTTQHTQTASPTVTPVNAW